MAYEKSYKSLEYSAKPPHPPYNEEYTVEGGKPIEDLRYHLLKLYSKRSHPLESLLNPATHTSDPMDFRLSWLLLQVLQTIGYKHCSELATAQLHTSFASQLENYGLWQWSIFVLMHISNQAQRDLAIQNILYKYVQLSDEHDDEDDDDEYVEKELFIFDELGIPQRWICWAKAVRAGAQNKYHLQADYLLQAEQWSLAHDVIMMEIAPDAIINGILI